MVEHPNKGERTVARDEAAIEAAKAKAAEAVRAAYARDPDAPQRTCPACGEQARTRFEHCPECGTSYFWHEPRLSRRARWAMGGLAIVAAAIVLAVIVPQIQDSKQERAASDRAAEQARLVAERRRLAAEQRPHRGRGARERSGAAQQLADRRALVRGVEGAITQDARARVAAGTLSSSARVRTTECGPIRRDLSRDELDLAKAIGRYDCVAVTRDVVQDGKVVGKFGFAFVAAVHFRSGTYVWCKNNPAQSERTKTLAFVRLDPSCFGLPRDAEPLGTGYVMPDE
jgi:predicted RNA-binding Zn-ribbon protein involved in translation (DUF1610 family)